MLPTICITRVLTVFHNSQTTNSALLGHSYDDVISNTSDESDGLGSPDNGDDGRIVDVVLFTNNGNGVLLVVTFFFASNDKDDEDDDEDDDDDDDEDEDDEFCFLISQYKSGRTLIIIDPDLIYGDCSRVSTDISI